MFVDASIWLLLPHVSFFSPSGAYMHFRLQGGSSERLLRGTACDWGGWSGAGTVDSQEDTGDGWEDMGSWKVTGNCWKSIASVQCTTTSSQGD